MQPCQHCDSVEVAALAELLQQKYFAALCAAHPDRRDVRQHKFVALKSSMLVALTTVLASVRSYSLNHISSSLDEFIRSMRTSYSLTGTNTALFSDRDPFCQQVQAHFTLEERQGVARAVVRKCDSVHEFHCSTPLCGSACVFAVVRCPHLGCGQSFSRHYWAGHDASCAHKPVPCLMQCRELVARNCMESHMQQACIMRLVPCTYAYLGCQPVGMT